MPVTNVVGGMTWCMHGTEQELTGLEYVTIRENTVWHECLVLDAARRRRLSE